MEIDVRGQVCPIPVIRTRKAIDQMDSGTLRVLLSSPTPAANVTRTAEELGCTVTQSRDGDTIVLTVEKLKAAVQPKEDPRPGEPATVVYVNSDKMGSGDDALGAILMKAFLQTLAEQAERYLAIVFVNAGVFLTTEGSDQLPLLQKVAGQGVDIVSCGTCLDFYHKTEELRVGRSSNMFEIVDLLTKADRTVTP